MTGNKALDEALRSIAVALLAIEDRLSPIELNSEKDVIYNRTIFAPEIRVQLENLAAREVQNLEN